MKGRHRQVIARWALVGSATATLACGTNKTVADAMGQNASVGSDAATALQPDTGALDSAAIGEVGDSAAGDGLAAGDSPVEVAADTATGPVCPKCPDGQKCRPDLGTCVVAGTAVCAPACPAGTVCGLMAPPTCAVVTCKLPTNFSTDVLKVTALQIAAADQGCEGVVGNALGKLAAKVPLVQQLLTQAVQNDQATVLLEPEGLTAKGGQGGLRWLFGTLSMQSLKCSPTSQTALCAYTVNAGCWDTATAGQGACPAWMRLPVGWAPPLATAKVGSLTGLKKGNVVAVPPGDVLQFAVPTSGSGHVLLQVAQPRLQAEIELADATAPATPLGWSKVSGRFCGVVPLADLDAALAGLPADVLQSLGGLPAALALRAQLLPGDTDLDGDGQPDAASAAVDFVGTRAKVVGITKPTL